MTRVINNEEGHAPRKTAIIIPNLKIDIIFKKRKKIEAERVIPSYYQPLINHARPQSLCHPEGEALLPTQVQHLLATQVLAATKA